MDKYIYDENNGFWYELQGDYYIPLSDLTCRKRKVGRLNTYLADIDRQAQERFERLVEGMKLK